MNRRSYLKKLTKLNMEMLSLKEDLKQIKTPFLKRYAEGALFTVEAALHLLIKRQNNGSLP